MQPASISGKRPRLDRADRKRLIGPPATLRCQGRHRKCQAAPSPSGSRGEVTTCSWNDLPLITSQFEVTRHSEPSSRPVQRSMIFVEPLASEVGETGEQSAAARMPWRWSQPGSCLRRMSSPLASFAWMMVSGMAVTASARCSRHAPHHPVRVSCLEASNAASDAACELRDWNPPTPECPRRWRNGVGIDKALPRDWTVGRPNRPQAPSRPRPRTRLSAHPHDGRS